MQLSAIRRHLSAATGALMATLALDGGCVDSFDAVAIATLATNRVSVPLGAPVEFTIQFDVAPALIPMDEDYRVFLHVFDDSEELLWSTDHEPPVPTSEWRPGQSIQYTRRVTIPAYPYVGSAVVGIGLQSPDSGVRLALAGNDLGEFVYRVATLQIEPQHESNYVVFDEGWYPVEFGVSGSTAWRWTTGRAVLSFRNPYRAARLLLDVEGSPSRFERPQVLSLVVGDRTIREVTLETKDVLHLDHELTEVDLGPDEVVSLALLVDQTFVPADVDSSSDTRELGVRVYGAYVEPLP